MDNTDKNQIVRRGGLLFAIGALFACMLLSNIIVVSVLGTEFQIDEVAYPSIVALQLMSSVVSFALAAFITSKYVFGSFKAVWGEERPKLRLMLLAVVAIFVCQHFIEWASMVNENLCTHFGYDYIAENKHVAQIMSRIISFDGAGCWATTIIVVGIVPAICEELYFRGALQVTFERTTRNARYAIVASSIVFALMHGQIASFFPIFLLGALLGIIYHHTRNLLINIIIHSLNNIFVIVVLYLSDEPIEATLNSPTESVGALMPIVSIIATLSVIYLITKVSKTDDANQDS